MGAGVSSVACRACAPGLLVFALLRKFAEEMDRAFSPKPMIGRNLGLRPGNYTHF